MPAQDEAVRRHVVARTNADDIAHGQIFDIDFFFGAALEPSRFGRREFDERFNRRTRPGGSAGFDDFAEQHEEGDGGRFLIMAGAERGDHCQGDQFVGAEHAATQVGDGGPDNRVAEQDRANHRAGIGHEAAFLSEHQVDDDGVEQKDQAGHRLLEAQGRVFVIVTAAFALGVRSMFVVLVLTSTE